MQSMVPRTSQHLGLHKSAYSGRTGASHDISRKCPDEEFFAMNLLAIKMKNKKYLCVLNLKARDLYNEAIKEKGMNFLLFHDWIEKEVTKVKYI